MNSLINFEEELDRWDKYWTVEPAGVCGFTRTKNAEKRATNEQVPKFFEETIERSADGYYIRFPFKEHHPPLPSNKARAFERLCSVLQMLQKSPDLLRDYNNTFVAQQERGIIEQVPDPSKVEGAILHYIPHQPVVALHKKATK
ncbi:hypothetical protein ANCDUO_15167 [Ancylostoma duodenale]|uniref:Uncharacterized protein n=1 Tax=Ancylostoma duodenale TaxID=51022 RepID=A0A0C2G160_9BILA|nr:hypothetical protein ANCDUO_15167 [Ancylostoma duodenale]